MKVFRSVAGALPVTERGGQRVRLMVKYTEINNQTLRAHTLLLTTAIKETLEKFIWENIYQANQESIHRY